jgi:hypothetical protein
MIGITTTLFWIFLIAFFASAVYSAKDIHLNFGGPEISAMADDKILFSIPVTVANDGFYDIEAFNITTTVLDAKGFTVASGTTLVPLIDSNDAVTLTHNMTVDVNDLLRSDNEYLFNDSKVPVYETVGLRLAQVIPVQASQNLTLPWGAPLYNFTVGEPAYSGFNVTYLRVSVPVSFENHALFDVAGNVQIRMYNNADQLLGEGKTPINTSPNTAYDGNILFYVEINGATSKGRLEVYIQMSFFNYGPLVILYG